MAQAISISVDHRAGEWSRAASLLEASRWPGPSGPGLRPGSRVQL